MLDIQRHSFKTGKSMPYGWNMEYVFDVLMQYTGIKDRNGKEIYEGDILEYGTGYMESVKYRNGCFMAIGRQSCNYLYSSVGRYSPVVIGNIYENPELLEVQND